MKSGGNLNPQLAIVLSCMTLSCCLLSPARLVAASIGFRPGEAPPPLDIEPDVPTSMDVITFTAPLDGRTYGNNCSALNFLIPFLEIDSMQHSIEIGAHKQPHPGICTEQYDPVTGVAGEFGPLAAGDWVLNNSHGGSLQFTVVAEPSTAKLSDLSNNGFVDFDDLTILLANWDQDAIAALGNIVDADGTPVNFDDLAVLLSEWTGPDPNVGAEAALGEAIPEPSSLLLALLATLGLSFGWRRRRRAF